MAITPGYVGATPLWKMTLNADYPSPGVDLSNIAGSQISLIWRDTIRNKEFTGYGTVSVYSAAPPAVIYYQVDPRDVTVASTYAISVVIQRPNGPDERDPVTFILKQR